jgi:hypothetical protein
LIKSINLFGILLYWNTDVAKTWMTVIGANTPAMIRSMTREVESRNLIVASMCLRTKPLAHKALTPRQLALALPRAESFSHYTLDAIIDNACHHGLASEIRKKESAAGHQSLPVGPGIFTAAGEPPQRPAFCTIVTSSE